MTLAREASLAVLTQAVLDLIGSDPPETTALRARLQEIGPEAAAAAARAREATGYRAPALDEPLVSIFSLVNAKPKSPPLLLLPTALTIRPQYPVSHQVDRRTLAEAVQSLRTRLLRETNALPPDPNALLFLLEKYGWSISAGAPGLAFADLARLTAAVAGALAHGADRLLLVGADLSGVQRFIYTISAKGALKSLRARSFFLELLGEELARRLLARLGLTRANLVYIGGGHLYLLAPDTVAARSAIQGVQAELNRWLLAQLDGKVYLAVGFAEFDPSHMAPGSEGVPEVWRRVSQALGQDKGARFRSAAADPAFWEPRPLGRATCEVCHRETDDPAPLDDRPGEEPGPLACRLCRDLYRLGGRLPHTRYLVAAAPSPQADLTIAGTGYYLCESASAARRIGEPWAVMALNALEAGALAVGGDPFPVWLGTYAPKGADGDTATFEELSRAAAGKQLLGVLRMDVDHLGRLFSGGLPPGCRDFGRTAGLSGALTRFFKLHLNSLCEGDLGDGVDSLRLTGSRGPRPVVVVYAGGDDLFVAGAWDQTLELAFDIRRAFHRFCGGRLSVSAGVVAADYHLPIHRLAEWAGEAEDAAKQNRDRDGRDRDSIAPLFTGVQPPNQAGRAPAAALKWDEAEEMVEKFLRPALGPLGQPDRPGTRLPRKLTYGLLGLVDYWVEHGPLYLPRLAYLLTRVDRDLQKDPAWEALRAYLLRHPYEMAQFPPFVTWLDLIGRGGSANE